MVLRSIFTLIRFFTKRSFFSEFFFFYLMDKIPKIKKHIHILEKVDLFALSTWKICLSNYTYTYFERRYVTQMYKTSCQFQNEQLNHNRCNSIYYCKLIRASCTINIRNTHSSYRYVQVKLIKSFYLKIVR